MRGTLKLLKNKECHRCKGMFKTYMSYYQDNGVYCSARCAFNIQTREMIEKLKQRDNDYNFSDKRNGYNGKN